MHAARPVPSRPDVDVRHVPDVPDVVSAAAVRAAWLASLTLRPVTEVIDIERAWGVWLSRQIAARSMAALGPVPRGTTVDPVDVRLPDGRRVVGEWVRARGVDPGPSAVYYVHGSGYVICSAATHRALASRLSRHTGLPVFVVDYRLAPRHRFPAAATDVRAGWDWLLAEGLDPDRVVLAGDSAGGHLGVDLVLDLAREGRARPAAMAYFSPLYDLTLGLAAQRERERRDPLISAHRAGRMVARYAGHLPAHHPRLRLDVLGGPPLPPALIQVGGTEMLAADAEALHRDLRRIGGRSTLEVWPGQVHVFQALPRLSPEAGPALRRAAHFLRSAVAAHTEEVSA